MQALSTGLGKAYVLSPHPFVLEELIHRLAASGATPEPIRLPYSVAPSLGPLPVEAEAVFILDACYPMVTTESLVSGLRSLRHYRLILKRYAVKRAGAYAEHVMH